MSQFSSKYDYILAGGGLSGQMMALELQRIASTDARILIIDRDTKAQNDRTWSYWSTDRTLSDQLARKIWSNIYVRKGDFEKTMSIAPYHYATIRGIDFYNFSKEKIKADARFEWIQEEIQSVNAEQGVVKTSAKSYAGELIFKSYFDPKEISIPSENIMVYQQFKGWFVKTEEPIFDDKTVTFMDFTTLEKTHETRFFYVLPFSKTEALVEYTAFAETLLEEAVFDQHLEWYFKEKLPATQFEIEETEFDFIPMTDFPFPDNLSRTGFGRVNKKVVNIGTTAAFVKASTGYCFTRTQEKIRQIGKTLEQRGKVAESDFASPIHYRIFDSAMLDATGRGGVRGDDFFTSLFKKMPIDFLFRFLDEKASLYEIIRTMLSVPNKGKLINSTFRKLLKMSKL